MKCPSRPLLVLGILALSNPTLAQSRPAEKTAIKDSDGDGVSDDKDVCPFLAGATSNNGCPPAAETAGEKPTPSVLSAPPATPAQSAAAHSGTTLMYETFDGNRRQWRIAPITGGKELQADIIGGAYQGVTGTKQTFLALVPVPLDATKPFGITLTTKTLMNLYGDGYGLAFGANASNDMYLLLLNGEKKFCIMKIAKGEQSFLAPWTTSEFLNPKGSNVISVKHHGGSWHVFLNGNKAYTAAAAPFFGDGIGVMQASDQAVVYDDLLVRSFTDGPLNAIIGPREGRFLKSSSGNSNAPASRETTEP